MFIVLYRWRIKPEKENQFIEGWAEVTAYFRENWDSLGSRLHRGNDDLFYAYAQWKSESDRENAFEKAVKLKGSAKMTEAIEERFEPIILENLSDFLVFSDSVK
ncbi:MAG: antibiotic biosynthesis monooxygenase [Acidobacteriota bacterium]